MTEGDIMAISRKLVVAALVVPIIIILTACGQRDVSESRDPAASETGESESILGGLFEPEPDPITVGEGTVLRARLDSSLSSNGSQAGQSFTAEVVDDVYVENVIAIPSGSILKGVVSEAVAAKRGAGLASLELEFTELELPSGYETDISANVALATESKKKRNAAIIGGSAAGGAILGKIIGKDTKGAVVGSIVGGAIGTGVVMSKEGEQISLPRGTELAVRLDRPATVEAEG